MMAFKSASPSFFWLFTQVLDYSLLVPWIVLFNYSEQLSLVAQYATQTVYITLWVNLREQLYFKLFPSPRLISKAKLESKSTLNDLIHLLTATVAGMMLSWNLRCWGFVDVLPITSVGSAAQVWIDYMAIVLIQDINLEICHSWMHKNIWAFKHFHATHHHSRKNCSVIHAYAFDPLDSFLELGLSQLLLLPIKYALGFPVTINAGALVLFPLSALLAHSANPHTALFFNPLLDYLFKPTINHTLHHAVPNSNFGVGISSVLFSWKQREMDIQKYQKTFGVDLGYKGIPAGKE